MKIIKSNDIIIWGDDMENIKIINGFEFDLDKVEILQKLYENFSDNEIYFIYQCLERDCQKQAEVYEALYDKKTGVEAFKKNCLGGEYKNLKEIHKRFKSLQKRCEKKRLEPPFEDSFIYFLSWWKAQYNNGKAFCAYCGVSEETTKNVYYDLKKREKKLSEKRSFSGAMQIDRKNPNEGYNKENCVFACVFCNNAKSDMITDDEINANKNQWEVFATIWKSKYEGLENIQTKENK